MRRRWWPGERMGDLRRLATPGAMAYAAVFPLVQIGLIAESTGGWRGGGYTDGGWALLATVAYLPLHLRHVRYAAQGARAPGGGWTLAAMTAVVAATVVPLGDLWLPSLHVVAVSALLVLQPRWSLPVVAVVVASQVPLPLLLDSQVPAAPSYYLVTILWRSAAVFVPVWLVGAVRRLEEARRTLADDAVLRERMRIDTELRDTLGAALDTIATRGREATALVTAAGEREPAAAALASLADDARRTLAQARMVIRGYQRPSLAAELDTAVALLRAAGVEAEVVLAPDVDLDAHGPLDEDVRSALRAHVARLVGADVAGRCLITVTRAGDGLRMDLRTGGPAAELAGAERS
jgi:two-component system, NarL family, sensor histidine kinase DesK